jgi:phosphotransacetylase
MILIPEILNPAVQELRDREHGMDLLFEDLSMEQSIERLNSGEVDALVIGADLPSADVIRAGIKQVGKVGDRVSSFFLMKGEGHDLFFADCAVNPSPTPEHLAEIAEQTVESMRKLGYVATVAFLSFSTNGSAAHCVEVQAVKEAADLFRAKHPDVTTYGDIQFDAAFNGRVFRKKVGGDGPMPNLFIFPDLNSGNIGYKIAEQMGGYIAVGPLLQGFKRPIFDLSRGVTADALEEVCRTVQKLLEADDGSL